MEEKRRENILKSTGRGKKTGRMRNGRGIVNGRYRPKNSYELRQKNK